VAAVVGDNDIICLQRGDHPDGVGFLPERGVCSAGEYTTLELLQHSLFKAADAVHGAVERERVCHQPCPHTVLVV